MSDPIENTQPTSTGESGGKARKRVWLRLVIIGWLLLIVVALVGGYTGYQTGSSNRLATQSAQNTGDIQHQYELGLQELIGQECERARQRFEWVLTQDPEFPGAIDALADAIVCVNSTATPTPILPTSTPTLTPTPDLRSSEEKFQEARQAMIDGDWEAAIAALFSLRKADPDYLPVDVDSMLYVAFRNRGVLKILNLGELESGLFDLAQAELFGPLDSEADGYRGWARLYLIGASFYSVQDWAQAAFYLGQVAPFAPNLHNGTSGFAIDWYLDALEKYITQLDEAEEWCLAEEQLEIFLQYNSDDALLEQLKRYNNRCEEDENG